MKKDYTFFPITFKSNLDFKMYLSLPLFTDSECDSILLKWDKKRANYKEHKKSSGNITRKCDIQWVDWYESGWDWVFEKISDIIEEANKEIFKFELSSPCTFNSIQFTKYNKNNYYNPHTDWHGENENHDIRKLSFSINLSKENNYVGGGLGIDTKGNSFEATTNKRGYINIFPSFLRHQASKIEEGERFTLVGWVVGPPFK